MATPVLFGDAVEVNGGAVGGFLGVEGRFVAGISSFHDAHHLAEQHQVAPLDLCLLALVHQQGLLVVPRADCLGQLVDHA